MNAAALLALQQIDSAIDAVANRRPRLPELATRNAAAAALAALRAAQRECSAEIDTAAATIERCETAGAALDTKKARLEAQLKTIIAPREAEALMSEIALIVAEHAELDEVELAAMEAQNAAETRRDALAVDAVGLTDALAAAEAALSAASAVLDAEERDLADRRPAAAAALTPAEIAAYDRARAQHGGVAVASLDGHHCSGCHLDLSPAELDAVRAVAVGDVAECPQCARYLVR